MSELRQRKVPTAGEVEEKVKEAEEYAKEKTVELTLAMKKKQEENIFDTTTKIRIIKEEIAYARSQLQPHDTGHIHTAISWMKERVKDLKKKPNLGE